MKDHPKYQKYFKMLKMGMPKVGVAIKMNAEGLNADVLDLDPEKPLPAKFSSAAAAAAQSAAASSCPRSRCRRRTRGPRSPRADEGEDQARAQDEGAVLV